MAMSLNGTTDYAQIDGIVGMDVLPISLFVRFTTNSLATANALLAAGMSATNGYHGLLFRGDNVGDFTELQSNNPSVSAGSAQASGVSSTTAWHTAYGSAQSASLRTAVLMSQGPTELTNGNSVTPAGTWNRIYIGRLQGGVYHAGKLAEVAGWNVALSARERDSLYRGYPASRIRPASLKFYKKLHGGSYADRINRVSVTSSGSTQARHPGCIGW